MKLLDRIKKRIINLLDPNMTKNFERLEKDNEILKQEHSRMKLEYDMLDDKHDRIVEQYDKSKDKVNKLAEINSILKDISKYRKELVEAEDSYQRMLNENYTAHGACCRRLLSQLC